MKRKLLHMLTAILLTGMLLTTTAYGTEASVSLTCKEEVAEGDSFSAALEYTGAAFASAVLDIEFNPEVLEFRSCSGGEGYQTGEGMARIQLSGGDGKEYLSCKIRFHGYAQGESFITATSSEVMDVTGLELVAETRSVKVTVVEADDVTAKTEEEPQTGESEDDSPDTEGGLRGFYHWVKAGIADGSFLNAAMEGYESFMQGLSIMEFLILSLCISVILLLLLLLAAEKKRGKD